MTENIPNEVLEIILHQAVTMSAKTFESWSTPAAFAGSTRSTVVNVLLVSRRWYDLAVPALYEAAILRTKAQVQGLARSVHKTNDRGIKRGAYLRHLRVEGGYNHHLHQILGDSPGIVTLFLGFDISLDDTSARLKRALQRINPTRLFLQSTPGGHATQDNTQSLYAAVSGAIPNWTNLTQVIASPEFIFWDPLVLPLKDTPALEMVSVSTYTATRNIQRITLDVMIENPSVKVVQIRDGVNWLSWKWNRPPYPREKFVLGEGNDMTPWADVPLPNASQSFPNGPLPDLPDNIWSRILGYATHVHGYNYLEMDDELLRLSEQEKANVTRRHVVLVSKRFHRLGLPHLYSSPHLSSEEAADAFAAQVESSPELAKLVRMLCVQSTVPLSRPLQIDAPLVNLVNATDDRIQVLSGIIERVPAGDMVRLERAVQSFPVTLSIAPRNFLHFPHLRQLTISGGRGTELDDTHHGALPQLECLNLADAGPGMFQLFGSMGLPRLRELGFHIADAEEAFGFLQVHGAKLDVLATHGHPPDGGDELPPLLSLCPNTTELHLLSVDLPENVPFVAESVPHAALKRVVCPSFKIGVPGKPQEEWKRWNAFISFLKIYRYKLPALEEFRIFHLRWPMHESAYRVSRFTQLALDLHELGISLADRDGTRWTRFDPLRSSLRPFR